MLLFPESEYEQRIGKITLEMDRAGIDALILTSDENTYYFTGFRSIVWDSKVSTPATAVITRDGDTALATSNGGRWTAGATSCVKDIRYYGGDGYRTYTDAIVSLLREKHLDKGRIGLELGCGHKMHLNYVMTRDLFAALKDAERVDASSILWHVRCIKSPAEIEKLRVSGEINVRAIEKGFSMVREGMTEMDLYGIIMGEYLLKGAERALPLGLRAGAERYSQSNCPPSYRPIGKGDIILVDGGPFYHGYCSDIIREAVIGAPTPHQQDVFNVARDACYAGLEAVKPGEPVRSVCDAVDKFFDNSRYAVLTVYKHWSGHSIGVGVHEYPMLDTLTDAVLTPGMVFAIEPYIYEEGVGSLGIEQNFVVTETGYDIISKSDDTLIRV